MAKHKKKDRDDNLNSGHFVVRIGAMEFPIKRATGDCGKVVLTLDFDRQRTVGGDGDDDKINKPKPIRRSGDSESVKDRHGLWLGDLLRLVDRNKRSDPALTLCVQGVETYTTRIVSAVRADNQEGDGPGGILWLHVKADEAKLSEAF